MRNLYVLNLHFITSANINFNYKTSIQPINIIKIKR